jgi:DNA-binding IclR family transcriptional regulator
MHRSERRQVPKAAVSSCSNSSKPIPDAGVRPAKVDPFVRPVDSYRNLHYVTKRDSAYCGVSNRLKAGIMPKAKNLTLSKSQAACLIALRHGKDFKTKIAIEAGLDLVKTAAALGALARLGLAEQGETKRWHMSARGKTCRFEIVPDRRRNNTGLPGSGGRRLLKLLDRPMRGGKIAEKLGVTHQRVRQLVIKLHAQGRVKFGDPDTPFWIVMRASDDTPFLSRDEERVLSAIPREYSTNATKIGLAARMPENKVHQTLKRLIVSRYVEATEGLQGNRVYRITMAGLKNPQRGQSARRAQVPRLPVESDRVRKVLSAILDAGALRIRDVTNDLSVPRQSMNALMQYLKRKQLVEKVGQEFDAPYSLTDEGRAVLAEMTVRHAA